MTGVSLFPGKRDTFGTGWRTWTGFVLCDASALCTAGEAFSWHECSMVIRTFVFLCRGGLVANSLFFCVASVNLLLVVLILRGGHDTLW